VQGSIRVTCNDFGKVLREEWGMLLQIQSSTSVIAVLPAQFVANEDFQLVRVNLLKPKLTLQIQIVSVSVCGFANDLVMVVSKSKGERNGNGTCCKAQEALQPCWQICNDF
jgi:hypothetical protein